jgi:hypothetical protein
MRRTEHRRDLREALQDGVSFDRVEALSRIPDQVGLLEHLDVAGVRCETARRSRFTADDELRGVEKRFLMVQPSLDESWYRIWGGVDGYAGAVIDKVLTEKADQYPAFPDGSRPDLAWRRATALHDLCLGEDPPPIQVTIFVDTACAAATNAETGVVIESGPRVGAETLKAVLCDSVTEVTAVAADGTPMVYGRTKRTVPPGLRRYILHRDGNRCTADGCPSRYRLQAHHIDHWARDNGPTNPDNLITLCWYHHHVIVHQQQYTIRRQPDTGRIRFKPPVRTRPPP